MNPNEMNEKFDDLTAQVDEMNQRLEDAREERGELLRQRFDLKEQRRYFRAQLREAKAEGNTERVEKIESRLDELAEQLEKLDEQIDSLENAIDETSDHMDDIMDQVDDLESTLDETSEPGEETEAETAAEGNDKITAAMEKLNSLLTKGFKKMADTIENIDFEKMGENVQSAANKAYRTVGGVASDAARNLDNAWNEAKESREQPGGIGDYRISGSSTIDGGCYNRITASGSCKVSSDLVCRELRVSGSFRALGGVDCNGPVRTTGALHCAGDLLAGSLSSSGSTKVQGNLESGPLTSTGGLNVGGNLKATALRSSGGLHVDGDVEADSFTSTGGLNVGGMVNADTVSIQTSVGQSTVGSIGGSAVRVYQTATGGLLNSLGAATGILTCDSIEGDDVDLTAVKAHVVRGATVVIRGGCEIDQVEYTDACTVEGDAKVGNCVKV
ncbi:MAG: hypothetical protein IJ206_13510 [Oscillospiraceae bacterium]|nr:hypothetical protein [Oscillospiraceae bacterium]